MAKDIGAKELAATNDVMSFAAERAQRYVREIRERRVAPKEKDVAALAKFREAFPAEPSDPRDVVAILDEIGSPATVASTGGRYFGFVVGGSLPAVIGANWLAGVWDQNVGLRIMSPLGAELEDVVLSLAGFGKKRVTIVEADGQGRMRADKLPRLSERTIVCIQAGNVNTGAFDPAEEICHVAAEQGAWVHVDGAFGLWARISHKYEHLTRGFEKADSWATDAHKWPNAGYDSGLAIVRDGVALRASMGITAAYLEPGSRREPMHHTPESSRRARGVELWAALKSLGRSGLCALIERTCAHAQQFARGLQEAGFAVLNDVMINQVLVSFGRPDVTREVIRRIQEDGTCWCAGTVWQGQSAMRISVSSWATTEADVKRSLASMIRIARECRAV